MASAVVTCHASSRASLAGLSIRPFDYLIDEGLAVPRRRMHIRHPDLDRPHPLGPQALAMLPHLAAIGGTAGGLGIGTRGGSRFHSG
jgi:hypothetical protein